MATGHGLAYEGTQAHGNHPARARRFTHVDSEMSAGAVNSHSYPGHLELPSY